MVLHIKLRELILSRSQGYDEMTGEPLDDTLVFHHRQLKSQGGKDLVENLVVLLHKNHQFAHLNPKWAIEKGLIVPSWDSPLRSKLTLHGGGTVTLTPEGKYD